jgi:NAD(P)-dependent dehydrogenase (short-subunit alcohol dehydrogenase family)
VNDKQPVALITGAGSGIGEAIAWRLAAAGHAIAINDVTLDRAQRVADELTAAGHLALGVAADVTEETEVQTMVARVTEALGPIGVLVNNAGVGDTPDPTVDSALEAWQRIMDINFRGVFVCSQQVGRGMVERHGGAIVNIASVLGLAAMPGRSAYGPSKAAVINLTLVLATEWGSSGVRVNAVAPGFVRTPLFLTAAQKGGYDLAGMEARIPAGRLAEATDVANAVAFLVSDQAAYVNGTTLVVDGGLTASIAVPT